MEYLSIDTARRTQQIRLELDAVPEAVLQSAGVMRSLALSLGFNAVETRRLVKAVSEIVLNACTYAYPSGEGKLQVEADCIDGRLEIEVADFGCGFLCDDYLRSDGSLGPKALPGSGLSIAAESVQDFSIRSCSTGTVVRMTERCPL